MMNVWIEVLAKLQGQQILIRPPGERCKLQSNVIALHQNPAPSGCDARAPWHSPHANNKESQKGCRHVPTHNSISRSHPPVLVDRLSKTGDDPCRLSDALQRNDLVLATWHICL